MGHDKLRKFAENETFSCLLQPDTRALLSDGYAQLKDHPVKGRWDDFFAALKGATPVSGLHFVTPSGVQSGERVPISSPAPLVLELGCGKGEYTVALAERYPERNFVGVDIKGARLWKGAKYATEKRLPNVGFLRTRIEFIGAFFGPSEVSEIWLTFSDPQIRRENARLTSPLFLERYRHFLAPDGVVHLKTDSRFLYEYTRAVCAKNGFEVLTETADLYGDSPCTGLPPAPEVKEVHTFYEDIFLGQGYPICYLAFRLGHDGPFVHPSSFDADYWRSVEGPRQLFGRDTAETRRQKLHLAERSSCDPGYSNH